MLHLFIDSFWHPHTHAILDIKDFKVHKYDFNGTTVVDPATVQARFRLNCARLSYGIARTICSYHPTHRELYFDTISSFLGLLCMVESSSKFLVSADRIKRLRDFSRTNRIGELAQGVNYLFTQGRLNFPYIVDYHLYCELKGISTSGSTPDFVVLNNQNQIGLMESKGGGPTSRNPKKKLMDALNQINIAERKLIPMGIVTSNKFPIFTQFKSQLPEDSIISYCDISLATSPTLPKPSDIFLIHYSSWFYLVGDFKRATTLTQFQEIENLAGDTDYTFDDKLQVYWRNNIDLNVFPERLMIDFRMRQRHHGGLRFGIKKNVVDRLMLSNSEADLPNNEDYPTDNNAYQWFKDGTVIRIDGF